MPTKRDYYQILGVEKSASADDIKKAYRKLAMKYHPDRNPGDKAAEDNFKEIGEAYEVLSDEQKRAAYDRFGHAAFAAGGVGGGPGGFGGGGFHDPFEVFREVFGGGGGGMGGIFEEFFGGGAGGGGGARRSRDGRQRGSDLRYDLQITLEEAAFGAEKELELEKLNACDECKGTGSRGNGGTKKCTTCNGQGQVVSTRGFFQIQQTCPDCGGSGQIVANPCPGCRGQGRKQSTTRIKLRIPHGIQEGSRLRSSGNGEAGVRAVPPGDLYVVIHIKEHDIFERDEDDLYCTVPLSFGTAALGGEVLVPTLDGKASVKIPAGTQSGTVFRLRGKGMPELNAHRRGDLLVRAQVEVPTKLNGTQREKLKVFSDSLRGENSPQSESFLEKAKRFFK
ncbi:MAG: molecular chaperone DnaJ [Verrucomicrobiales bacterium]